MAKDAFNPVTPEKLIRLAVLTHLSGNNLCIMGPPGCGKSDIPRNEVGPAISAITGEPCVVAWLPNAGMEACDWRGLPTFDRDNGLTVWMRPGAIPDQRDVDKGKLPKRGVIVVDEFNQNHAGSNAPMHQLLLGASFGSIQPAKNYTYILTGNRLQDGAMAQKTATSLNDRVIICTLEPSIKDWCTWGRKNGIRQDILAYIERIGDTDLFNFDPKRDVNATPRSWAMLSKQLDRIDEMRSHDLLDATAVGLLGEGIGKKYVSFREQCRKLVKIESIIKDPMKAGMPDNAGVTQFVTQFCAYRTTAQTAKDHKVTLEHLTDQISKYLHRFDSIEWLAFYLGELRYLAGQDADALKFYKENKTLQAMRKEAEVDE